MPKEMPKETPKETSRETSRSLLSGKEAAKDKSRSESSARSLRPSLFKDFSGQTVLKKKLQVFISAARKRGGALDHILFYGPPGLGKTTLARITAHEMGGDFRPSTGPAIRRVGDLAVLLTSLKPRSCLFIDEIHRLSADVEEYLYSAMEDFFIDIVTGDGLGAQAVRFHLPPFTLIGATTRAGLLKAPLRDRFGIVERLDFYSPDELSEAIRRSAKLLNMQIQEDSAMEIARRSRGTPRIANRLLKRIRDYSEVQGKKIIDKKLARFSLDALGVNERGLNGLDQEILRLMKDVFNGGPVGVETLAAALSEEPDTLEDFHEPYLLREGLIQKTPRGRVLADKS